MRNQWCVQKPTANIRQQQFLSYFEREAFYGGSAGGGKSSALLMAAAQFVQVPNYAAILFRRTFADLALPGALMDRAIEWWGGTVSGQKAHWNSQEHKWTFPSGATISFGYLEREADKFRYQSSEFQFIGWDELTQFSETQYRFLFSRLRKLEGSEIPLRVRAASNPGGSGHVWVKNRFVAPSAAARFFPAKLSDNPYLDQDEYVRSLNVLDPFTRSQYLSGSWDDYEGGRFKREWFRYYRREGDFVVFGNVKYHPEQIADRFLTVDPSSTVKETVKDDPDWTVVSSWGFTPCKMLVWLGCARFRDEIPDIIPREAEEYRRWGCGIACVEGGAQKGVFQLSKRWEFPGGHRMNVVELIPKAKEDKVHRATEFMNLMEAGRVWMPQDQSAYLMSGAFWCVDGARSFDALEEAKAELLAFTGDQKKQSHDDIVDTCSWAGKRAAVRQAVRQVGFKAQRVIPGVFG